MKLTAKRLRKILHYDPVTGVWTWLFRPRATPQWNGHFAGKRAGGVDPDTGYWRIRIGDRLYYAHRLAFLYMTGKWPPDEVDHRALTRDDCRWDCLRPATHSQNGMNKKPSAHNKSGFRGVYRNKRSGLWHAEVQAGDIRKRKSGFPTARAAAAWRNETAKLLHGEFQRAA